MVNDERHTVPIDLLTKLLANEVTTEERDLANNWIAASDANTKEYKAIKKLWDEAEKGKGKADIDIDAEWCKMERNISKGKTITLKRALQIAASIVILCVLSFVALKQINTTSQKTRTAEITEFKLPDGSTINLNAESKINYKKGFGTEHRNLVLTGEAYFKVAKDENLPFIISACDARIQVVGTKFYVKAYKENPDIKVTVTDGKVKLYSKKRPEKEVFLTAGQSGTLNKKEQIIQQDSSPDINDIAWKTHQFSFNNTTIDEAAKVLGKAYHKEIVVKENMKNCSVTVTFEDLDLNTILKVLKSTLDLKITTDGNRIIISGNGCE